MADPVKIRVDIANGTVEVEATSTSFGDIFDRVTDLLPRLADAYQSSVVEEEASEEKIEEAPASKPEEPARKRANRSASRTKETYKIIELGLSESERENLRSFFREKAPKSQNDQTAVLMDWFKREKNMEQLDRDQVFTAFRTVDVRAPGKISSVLGNMSGQGMIVNKGGKFGLTHVGEDHVKFKLPSNSK